MVVKDPRGRKIEREVKSISSAKNEDGFHLVGEKRW